jgi:O-antigen ligase
MGLMLPVTWKQHAVYMYTLFSAFLIFWLCCDLTKRLETPSKIINVFVMMNLVAIGYCAVQLWLGPGERLTFFGLPELAMTRVREDGRLTGPFESAEITAQYFLLMTFLTMHQYWHAVTPWAKRGLALLAATNVALLIATGSRGEFILLIAGSAMYLWLFRNRLGPIRAISFAVAGTAVLAIAALFIVALTPFGTLFDRLSRTQLEGGVPDTREQVWPDTWKEIVKSPIVGHGPRFRFANEHRGEVHPGHTYMNYPHNLYLFLLYTVGIPGLVLFLTFQLRILFRCWRAASMPTESPYFSDLARTGVILMTLFLIDGIKIDQMRLNLADYWHFWFGLCGVLVAACSHLESQAAAEMPAVIRGSTPMPFVHRTGNPGRE